MAVVFCASLSLSAILFLILFMGTDSSVRVPDIIVVGSPSFAAADWKQKIQYKKTACVSTYVVPTRVRSKLYFFFLA